MRHWAEALNNIGIFINLQWFWTNGCISWSWVRAWIFSFVTFRWQYFILGNHESSWIQVSIRDIIWTFALPMANVGHREDLRVVVHHHVVEVGVKGQTMSHSLVMVLSWYKLGFGPWSGWGAWKGFCNHVFMFVQRWGGGRETWVRGWTFDLKLIKVVTIKTCPL